MGIEGSQVVVGFRAFGAPRFSVQRPPQYREEQSMDQCRSRLKLSENFERHWPHTNFRGNSYGPIIGPYLFLGKFVWTNGPESSSKVPPYTGIGPWMALPCNTWDLWTENWCGRYCCKRCTPPYILNIRKCTSAMCTLRFFRFSALLPFFSQCTQSPCVCPQMHAASGPFAHRINLPRTYRILYRIPVLPN